jgi:hypothetical protein
VPVGQIRRGGATTPVRRRPQNLPRLLKAARVRWLTAARLRLFSVYVVTDPLRARLLVVDNEDVVRTLFARMLRDCGYDVVEAANGRWRAFEWDLKGCGVTLLTLRSDQAALTERVFKPGKGGRFDTTIGTTNGCRFVTRCGPLAQSVRAADS